MKKFIQKITNYLVQRNINRLLRDANDMRAFARKYQRASREAANEAQRIECLAYSLMRDNGILHDALYAPHTTSCAPYKIELRTKKQIEGDTTETCF